MARIVIRSDGKIICPHCKHEHEPSEYEWWESSSENLEDIECENCEEEFQYLWIERNPIFESYKKEEIENG